MMFKERWAFVGVVFMTVVIVYTMPLGDLLYRKCRCPKPDCHSNAPVPRDMIIHSNKHLENQSFNDILNLQRKFQPPISRLAPEPEFKMEGWVLDCVTWDTKWESPTLDAEPHVFTLDDIPSDKRLNEDNEHRENTFVEIFKKKDWPANDPSYSGLQVSGPGSMLKNAQGVIATLHVVITKLKQHLHKPVITVLDLPCGDLQWIKKFLVTRNDIEYTGADIVPDIISHHKKLHHDLPRVRFMQLDIVKSPLNQSFDLILCRDMLQHLWKHDAMKALYHFSQSNSSFLLATTFPDTSQNGDVEKDALGGRKYSYNLELPPFSLAPPICSSYDWNVEHMSLWSLPLKQKYDI